jgi:hypothetical protein
VSTILASLCWHNKVIKKRGRGSQEVENVSSHTH